MSGALSAERDQIQREVEELERNLSVSQRELELLSSETDNESDSEDFEDEETSVGQSSDLLAEREKLQKEIQNLEEVLGDYRPVCDSDDDDGHSSESDLGLSTSVESCLQMNLVYQQVIEETLNQLQTLLTQNYRQQKELTCQLSGPIRESSREQNSRPSYQQPITMYLGHFLKPYFKDKLTGLGPPANQETKGRSSRMTGCLENNKLKLKRWQSWQRSLLIHCVSKDCLKRIIQPKLSKLDFLSVRLSSTAESDKQQLREQINTLEHDINLMRGKNEEEMIGARDEEHDWQKISNVDFEGLRDPEDVRCFWINLLHPSINKSPWQPKEMLQLKEVARRRCHRHWDSIAEELGTGRTAFMCLQMFQRFLSDSLKRSIWTPDEDNLLKELVDRMRIGNFIPYTQISYFMEGRQPTQLIYRWNQVLDPRLKKGPWTAEEDKLLLQAVSRHGEKNWFRIRLEVPGRTDCSCRDRYLDCLKEGLKKGSFDSEEKSLLLQLVKKHGVGHWSKISAEIPRRNDAQCLRAWRALRRIQDRVARGSRKPVFRGKHQDEEERSSEEDQEVEYMDSSEEERVKEVKQEEKQYSVPPMKAWLPAEQPVSSDMLTFRSVAPPLEAAPEAKRVRCTLVGNGGNVTALFAPPMELGVAKHCCSPSMLMATQQQLQAHTRHLFQSLNNEKLNSRRAARRVTSGRINDPRLNYQLQAAVTPWIGNLLIPERQRRLVSDAVREQTEKSRLAKERLLLTMKDVFKEGGQQQVMTSQCSLPNQHASPPVTSSTPQLAMQHSPGPAHIILPPSTPFPPLALLAPPSSVATRESGPFLSALNPEATFKLNLPSAQTNSSLTKIQCMDRDQLMSKRFKRHKEEQSEDGLLQDKKRHRKPTQKVGEQHESNTAKEEQRKRKKSKQEIGSTPSSTPPPAAPLTCSIPPSALVLVPSWQTEVQRVEAPPPVTQKSLQRNVPIMLLTAKPPSWGPLAGPTPLCQPQLPVKEVLPPSLRRKDHHSDWSLLFLSQSRSAASWLSVKGRLFYLPPSTCTLRAFSELLRTRKDLITSSNQLLRGQDSCQSNLSTWTNHRPGLSTVSEEQQEVELLSALQLMVKDHFETNSAYHTLKNHFLSCFTMPALLATIQPIREQPDAFQQEDELQKRERE